MLRSREVNCQYSADTPCESTIRRPDSGDVRQNPPPDFDDAPRGSAIRRADFEALQAGAPSGGQILRMLHAEKTYAVTSDVRGGGQSNPG